MGMKERSECLKNEDGAISELMEQLGPEPTKGSLGNRPNKPLNDYNTSIRLANSKSLTLNPPRSWVVNLMVNSLYAFDQSG